MDTSKRYLNNGLVPETLRGAGQPQFMKRRLLQSLRYCRPGGGSVLVLAFLLLPYLVDVAYYGDFTATHFAQKKLNSDGENNGENGEEDLLGDGPASPVLADNQAKFKVGIGLPLSDVYALCRRPAETVFAPQYLFVVSLTSRPPPTL